MKRIIMMLMALFVCMFTMAQAQGLVPTENATGIAEFLKQNWQEILVGLLAFMEVITRLTPTKKDNTILKIISKIIDAILPNLKKGGGKHIKIE